MNRGKENKPHVGFYGRGNTGKSSFVNFLTGADVSIVSDIAGTTTDPVKKSIEILDFSPVIMIDTAGFNDVSDLGESRAAKSIETLMSVDLAIMLFSHNRWGGDESRFMKEIIRNGVPYLLIHNRFGTEKLRDSLRQRLEEEYKTDIIEIDIYKGGEESRNKIFGAIKRSLPDYSYIVSSMFGDQIEKGDLVFLVCPVDSETPSGRIVLPQVQAIRDILDKHCYALVMQPEELESAFAADLKPKMVVTDTQVIDFVASVVPPHIPVTSFSILLAQMKGDMDEYTKGLEAVCRLTDGDRVLILENCLHQASCDDVGTVKIPRWLQEYTGKKLEFTIIPGLSPLPADVGSYAFVVQCGGCMVTRRQLMNRIRTVVKAGVPVTNYGMLIKKIRVKQ